MDPISLLVGLLEGLEKAPVYIVPAKNQSKRYVLNPDIIVRDETSWCGSYILFNGDTCTIINEKEASLIHKLYLQDQYNDTDEEMLKALVEKGVLLEDSNLKSKRTYCSKPIFVKPPYRVIECLKNYSLPIPSAPFMVDLYVTFKCNLKCVHCGYSCTHKPYPLGELSFDEWKKILDILDLLGVFQIRIQGGEPLLYPDITKILHYACHMHYSMWVFTNGTFMKDEALKIISSHLGKIKLSISLDGGSEKSHDKFRGVKGAFNNTIKTLSTLKKYSNTVTYILNIVLHKENIDEIREIYDIAYEYGAKGVSFVFLNYVGRALSAKEYWLTPPEQIEALKKIIPIASKYSGLGIGTQIQHKAPFIHEKLKEYHIARYLSGILEQEKTISKLAKIYLKETHVVCPAGILRMCIAPNGDIYPCEVCLADVEKSKHLKAGNILSEDFYTIWSKGWTQLRNGVAHSRLEECDTCKYKKECGMKVCRLYALISRGSEYLAPPECSWGWYR